MELEFSPSAYNYELVGKENGVFRYQKISVQKDSVITDLLELAWWSEPDYWIIYVDPERLHEMFPKHKFPSLSDDPITLYVGEIRCHEDYEFLINRIVKKPEIIKLIAGTETTLFSGKIELKEKPKDDSE